MSDRRFRHTPLTAAVISVLATGGAHAGSYGGYIGARSGTRGNGLATGPAEHASQTLDAARAEVERRLQAWARGPRFEVVLEQSLGADFDRERAAGIRDRMLAGDWRDLPRVQVRHLERGAAAFDHRAHALYLDDAFLATAPADRVAAVWLEEIGHALDALLRTQDSPGDEGDLFSRLVRGETVSMATLAALRLENDWSHQRIGTDVHQLELATFTVTNTNDSGGGSLRDAIAQANGAGGMDSIVFNAGLDGMTITLTSGELTVTEALSIDGDTDSMAGTVNITVSGGGDSRVFNFTAGSTNSIINNLAVVGGNLAGNGGNLSNSGAAAGKAADQHGAGIFNAGVLTITNSEISGNSSGGGGGGAPSGGGGGAFGGYAGSVGGDGGTGGYGTMGTAGSVNAGGNGGASGDARGGYGGSLGAGGGARASGSTGGTGGAGGTAGNAGGGGGAGGENYTNQDGGDGANVSGGIYNSGTLVITGSTITSNLAAAGGGGGGGVAGTNAYGGNGGNAGGAIYNATGGNLTIDQATIDTFAGNLAGAGAGGTGGNANGTAGVAAGNIYGMYTVSGTEMTFYVDNTGDVVDGNYAAGQLTLREALNMANNNDTIAFDATLDGQTITLGSSLVIAGLSVDIDGDRNDDTVPDITLSGNNANTILVIQSGAGANVDGVSFINGAATGAVGGVGSPGMNGSQGNAGDPGGVGGDGGSVAGAIINGGSLTVANSYFNGNAAVGGAGGVGGPGGNGGDGIAGGGVGYSGGQGGNGGRGGHAAGGILNLSTGILAVTNSVFSGNSASGGDGGTAGSGGSGGAGTTSGTNGGGGGGAGGGGAGGYGGTAGSAVVNLGTISGDATVDNGDTADFGTGGTGGLGGDGGDGGSPAGTGTGATGGAGGGGGPAETSGSNGSPGNNGDASGGNGGNGGIFNDPMSAVISQPGSGSPSGQTAPAGAGGGGGGAGGGAGGVNGGTDTVVNAESGTGMVTLTVVPVELQSFEID